MYLMVFQEIDLLAQVSELKAGIAETTLKSVPANKVKDLVPEAGKCMKADWQTQTQRNKNHLLVKFNCSQLFWNIFGF